VFFVCFFLNFFSGCSGWAEEKRFEKLSHVPPNFEELSNPLGGHTSHRAKSWSYQYSNTQLVKPVGTKSVLASLYK
jgi:hypothetical protein